MDKVGIWKGVFLGQSQTSHGGSIDPKFDNDFYYQIEILTLSRKEYLIIKHNINIDFLVYCKLDAPLLCIESFPLHCT